jgi:glutamine amidotransferase
MSSRLVAVISYGTGNIASLEEAFAALGASCRLAQVPADLYAADAIVLPGVGHFGPAVTALAVSGLQVALIEQIRSGLPTLGICLGFQLLTTASEEAPQIGGAGIAPFAHRAHTPSGSPPPQGAPSGLELLG